MIDKYGILNGATNFSSGVFLPPFLPFYYLYHLKNTLNILVALLEFIRGILMECQKKILEI